MIAQKYAILYQFSKVMRESIYSVLQINLRQQKFKVNKYKLRAIRLYPTTSRSGSINLVVGGYQKTLRSIQKLISKPELPQRQD